MMKEEDCQGMFRITKTRITFFLPKPCGGQKKVITGFCSIEAPGQKKCKY